MVIPVVESFLIHNNKGNAIENRNNKVWLFLGESKHKIKKKAEQSACKLGYQLLNCQ